MKAEQNALALEIKPAVLPVSIQERPAVIKTVRPPASPLALVLWAAISALIAAVHFVVDVVLMTCELFGLVVAVVWTGFIQRLQRLSDILNTHSQS